MVRARRRQAIRLCRRKQMNGPRPSVPTTENQMKRIVIAASAAALTLAVSAQAYEIYTDYAPSRERSRDVAMVNVNPNRIDDYLEGLEQTWVSGWKSAEQMTMLDCAIYVSSDTTQPRLAERHARDEVSERRDAGSGCRIFKKFQAEMRDFQDKQDKLVEGYDQMRTFFGEQTFRKIEFKSPRITGWLLGGPSRPAGRRQSCRASARPRSARRSPRAARHCACLTACGSRATPAGDRRPADLLRCPATSRRGSG